MITFQIDEFLVLNQLDYLYLCLYLLLFLEVVFIYCYCVNILFLMYILNITSYF